MDLIQEDLEMENLNRKTTKKFIDDTNLFFVKKEARHAFLYLLLSSLGGIAECSAFYILSKIGFGIVTSNIVGFGFWSVTSFSLNAKKNFEKQDFIKIRFTIYIIISLIWLLLSTWLVYFFTKTCWFSLIVSKLLQQIIMAVPLYIANRLITFGDLAKLSIFSKI